MTEVYNFNGQVIGWDEDETPESGDSDGDLVPPMDGDDETDESTDEEVL